MTSSNESSRKPESVVIWGAGGHGHVVADLLRTAGGWALAGFVDNLNPPGTRIMDLPVLGDADQLPRLRDQGVRTLVAAIGDCAERMKMLRRARELGFRTPTLVHPSCIVSSAAVLDDACVLCAGAIVGPGTRIGTGAILNTRAAVDHDNRLDEGVHVAPGAVLCGFVSVGRETWIGAGAVVRDHLTIGQRVIVGACATVLRDVPDGQTVDGTPARSHRKA